MSKEPDNDIPEAEKLEKQLRKYVQVGAVVAILIIALYFVWLNGPLSRNNDDWAGFGDFVGGVLNPWFSFLAIIALLGTISLQVTELRLTKAELAKSAEALQAQNETLRKQTFESTYFKLLQLYMEIVDRTEVESANGRRERGKACFKHCYQSFSYDLFRGDSLDTLADQFAKYVEDNNVDLERYVRTIYRILQFINNTNAIDKDFYIALLKSQLSDAELAMVFYFSIVYVIDNEFKPLVENLAFFDEVPVARLIPDELLSYYEVSAYGTNEYPSYDVKPPFDLT